MTGPWPRAAAAAAALLLAAASARADVTFDGAFGFDGVSVPGAVTPVRVSLASSEKAPVNCTVELSPAEGLSGVGGQGVITSTRVFLGPGARKRLTLPVLSRNAGWNTEWILTVRTDRRTLLRSGTAYAESRSLTVRIPAGSGAGTRDPDPGSPVVGVLGDPGLRTGWLAAFTAEEERSHLVRRGSWGGPRLAPEGGEPAAIPSFVSVSPEAAPDTWLGYEGFDALLWVDPDPDSLGDAAQLEAILEYAATGGRLVVALTAGSRLPAASPLARALPALPLGHDDARASAVLAALTEGSGQGTGNRTVPVARLGEIRGRTSRTLPGGGPLVAGADHGLGTVVALAFDPRLLDGAGVADRAALLRLLFGPAVHVSGAEDQNFDRGGSLEPLLNHLRKRFLTAPPILLLVLALVLYVLAIGPLDYFWLKKRNRLRRTVVTFPLIVLVFTLLAYGASFLLFGGSSGQVRVAWVDFATAPGRDADVVRGVDVLGSYSPTGTTLEARYDQPRSFLAAPWIGGGRMGGFGEGAALDGAVVLGPDGRPAGAFSVPLRSHRTLQARFSGEIPAALDASVRSVDGRRSVEIRNGLRTRVRDLTVVVPRRGRLFPAGDLAPGGTVEVGISDPGKPGTLLVNGPFPDPMGQGGDGLFSGSWGRGWGGGSGQFSPADSSESAAEEARRSIARAAMGASFAGFWEGERAGSTLVLGRQGIDLSRQAREGRIVVLGWCDGDPLGNLPAWRSLRSTVVVVRRVLPATEEAR